MAYNGCFTILCLVNNNIGMRPRLSIIIDIHNYLSIYLPAYIPRGGLYTNKDANIFEYRSCYVKYMENIELKQEIDKKKRIQKSHGQTKFVTEHIFIDHIKDSEKKKNNMVKNHEPLYTNN